jgi:hypothetical protein
MPTFRYDKLSATSYRVIDAHTGEAYGVIRRSPSGHGFGWDNGPWLHSGFATRDDAARALYTARYARGFEAGAL